MSCWKQLLSWGVQVQCKLPCWEGMLDRVALLFLRSGVLSRSEPDISACQKEGWPYTLLAKLSSA